MGASTIFLQVIYERKGHEGASLSQVAISWCMIKGDLGERTSLEVSPALSSPQFIASGDGISAAELFEQGPILPTNPNEAVFFGVPCSQQPNNKGIQVCLVTFPLKLFLCFCVCTCPTSCTWLQSNYHCAHTDN